VCTICGSNFPLKGGEIKNTNQTRPMTADLDSTVPRNHNTLMSSFIHQRVVIKQAENLGVRRPCMLGFIDNEIAFAVIKKVIHVSNQSSLLTT